MPRSRKIWVFGYGSLIWKVHFPYQGKVVGYITSSSQHFRQDSTAHYRVPDMLGRIVTRVEDLGDSIWGVTYKLPVGKKRK